MTETTVLRALPSGHPQRAAHSGLATAMRRRRVSWRRGMHLALATAGLAGLAVGAGFPGLAHAQSGGDLPDATFRATRGVHVPAGVRAGDADATAVELNPGQLALLPAGAAALVADVWRAQAAMPGRGAGLFLAAPLWGAGGVGVALQGIGASGAGALTGHGKFQLGYGLGGRTVGLGISWAHLFGGGVGGTDTFDAGLAWRPFSGMAAALVLEDFARPRLGDAPERLPRRWVGELAVRPLGSDRLEFAAAALHLGGEPWSRTGSRFRATGRVAGAWRLLAELEVAPRRPGALPAGSDTGRDWRATVGFAVDFDHGSMALAARRSFTPPAAVGTTGDGASGENWGASAVLRSSSQRTTPSASAGHAVRITIEGVDSDREFVSLALQLRRIARDNVTTAVLLKLEGLELGVGRIEELRDLIGEVRDRGKKVVAYLTSGSMRNMYLASACDRIVMHPAGGMTFAGVAQAVTFYKGAMDRLGVGVELVRIAEFKGAMEPYVMTGQSAPVRENRNQLLDDVYGRMLAGIAAGRAGAVAGVRDAGSSSPAAALDVARLAALVNVGSFTPQEAQTVGLVDAVRDQHETEEYLRTFVGDRGLDIRDPDRAPTRSPRWTRPRIAVVMVDGTITDGPSQSLPFDLGGVAGGDTLVKALEECRRRSDIRAVVLRVNSPGGSAFSSDAVARAVSRLRAAGKPVVTSMGDVAASGGYYIAAPTDTIFAQPSTTTGSIGIFAFKLDLARLLAMLSVNVEVLRRGPHADQQASYRAWTPEERAIAERRIRHMYQMFVDTVASGRQSRGLSAAQVDQVGRGHVWTGAQAQARGLVDAFGGVIAALDRAAALGRVPLRFDEEPDLVVLPRSSKTILQTLADLDQAHADADGTGGDGASPVAHGAPAARLAPPLREVARLAAPYLFGPGEGIEARLPFDLDIR